MSNAAYDLPEFTDAGLVYRCFAASLSAVIGQALDGYALIKGELTGEWLREAPLLLTFGGNQFEFTSRQAQFFGITIKGSRANQDFPERHLPAAQVRCTRGLPALDQLQGCVVASVNVLYRDAGRAIDYLTDGGQVVPVANRRLTAMEGLEFVFSTGAVLIICHGPDNIAVLNERRQDVNRIPVEACFPRHFLGFIRDFRQTQEEVVGIFRKTYGTVDLQVFRVQRKVPKTGSLPGIIHYNFHGTGLYAELHDRILDFDFGENSRADGFTAHWLARFAVGIRDRIYPEFEHEAVLAVLLDRLQRMRIIYHSADRNYYLSGPSSPT